jgi:membrane fusion protein (multidrug efflux system)
VVKKQTIKETLRLKTIQRMNRNPHIPGIARNSIPSWEYLAALIFISLAACKGENPVRQQAEAMPYPTVEVTRRTVTEINSYPASIEGVVNSEVRAKVSGYIQEVQVDEGQHVAQGQPLFKLETQILTQDASAAKARVRAAQVEVDKLEPLVAQDIISPVQLETARANLEQSKSAYQGILANIGYANIRSPIEGVVGTINYRRGNLVSAQDPKPLTTISKIERVYAYFSMNEKEFITFMKENEADAGGSMTDSLPAVELILADGSVYGQKGKIETISGSVDPQTGSIRFRAAFPNPQGVLRNGSSGTIRLSNILDNVLVVPSVSTYEQQGKTFVYLVQDGVLDAKSIEVLGETRGLIVMQGLDEGTQILASGVSRVRPGTTIVPQPTTVDSIVQSFEPVFK